MAPETPGIVVSSCSNSAQISIPSRSGSDACSRRLIIDSGTSAPLTLSRIPARQSVPAPNLSGTAGGTGESQRLMGTSVGAKVRGFWDTYRPLAVLGGAVEGVSGTPCDVTQDRELARRLWRAHEGSGLGTTSETRSSIFQPCRRPGCCGGRFRSSDRGPA